MSAAPQMSAKDAEIWAALTSDPEARRKLAPEVRRLKPEVPIPEYDQQLAFEQALKERITPLQERLDNIEKEKQQRASDDFYARQRAELKQRYGYTDEGVQKFEERMGKEWQNGQLSYSDIHYYFQAKDHPLPPASVNVGISGVPRSSLEAQWRADMKNPETNPGCRAFRGDRREYFRSYWNKASEELPR